MQFLTTTEAAQKLGISSEWLRMLARRKRVTPHATIGSHYGWSLERLDELAEQIAAAATPRNWKE